MITINYEQTASFDVDPQAGFTSICPDELPVPDGENIVEELNATAKCARYRIGSSDWHSPDGLYVATKENPQFSVVGLPNVDVRWNKHCQANTKGAELLSGLPDWLDYDFFIHKGMRNNSHPYGSAFHDLQEKRSTGVIEWLKVNKVSTVLIGGLAREYCCKETAIQLKKAGFRVIFNLAATRAINVPLNNGETTLTLGMKEMKSYNIEFIDNVMELCLI